MSDYPVHPIAECYPPPTAQEYAELKEDIRANGLLHPIVLFEEKILCGIQRKRICKEFGIPPIYITPQITDPIAYAKGDHTRRQWTRAQLAVVGEKLANLKKGGDGSNQYVKAANAQNKALAGLQAIARRLGVSKTQIDGFRYIRKNGIPELFEAVEANQILVDPARKIAHLSKDKQRLALEEALRSKSSKTRAKPTKQPSKPKPNGQLSSSEVTTFEARMNAASIYPEDLPLPVHPDPGLNGHIEEAFIDLKAKEPLIPKMSRRQLYDEVWVYTQRIQTFAPGYGKPAYIIPDINPRWVEWARNVAGKVRAAEFLLLDKSKNKQQSSSGDFPKRKRSKFSEAGFEKQLKRWQRALKRELNEILFAPDQESRVFQATEQILITHFEDRRTRRTRASHPLTQTGEPNHTAQPGLR
jgi:hypothetical protein